MALTKVTGQVINDTTGLVVGVTTVGGGLSATDGFFSGIVTFSQGVSIGGTLTYEDVTNIDSVGLITARAGVVVGSGITLSKDGDIFATGIVTATSFVGSGSGLTGVASTDNIRTNTNATFLQNINVSGTVTATSYAGDGSALTGIGGTDFIHSEQINNSGVTTTGTAVVGSAVTISSDGIDAVGVAITAANINGGQIGRRNKIINGGMRINQRGGDDAVSFSTNSVPSVDRYHCNMSTDGSANIQRSDDYPAGSGTDKSLLITITSADSSLASNQYMYLRQIIEGNDMADAAFGLSSAKTCTLSFWVKCSVTGTFGGSFWNNSFNRSYPYNYTINSANTWEKKVIVFPGDTSGTWLTTNGRGISVGWAFGIGSDYVGTANQWNGAGDLAPTSHVSLIATNGATWRITAVQFEIGDQPTPFESRPRGEELALCQRYFQIWARGYLAANAVGSGDLNIGIPLTTPLRTTPTTNSGFSIHRSGNQTNTASFVSADYQENSTILEVRMSGFSVTDEVAYNVTTLGGTNRMEISAEL